MAINKKLIHFNKKEKFNEELANRNILNNSIVFILDSKEISTHGTVYKTVNWSILEPKPINKGILYEALLEGIVVDFEYPVHSDVTICNNTNGITFLVSEGTASSDTGGLSNFDIYTAYTDPREDEKYVYQLVRLINFTVDSTAYQAEEGMTWGEWANSDYNTFFENVGKVYIRCIVKNAIHSLFDESLFICDENGFTCNSDSVIIDGKSYTTGPYNLN